MNKKPIYLSVVSLFFTLPAISDPIPAAASYYPGETPLVAARILGEATPVCDNGESVESLGRMNFNLFSFDIPGPLSNGQQSTLDTYRVKVNSSVLGIYENNHWYFMPSATPGYNLEQPFFDILAFSQAERFLSYLDDYLEANITTLTKAQIYPDMFSNTPLNDGPATNFFGMINIPNNIPGGCNNTVRWLEDGSVMPHEIGGHLLTDLTHGADPLNEALGDYWGLVMTWDSINNPNPKVGEWIDVQFNNSGRYLRDPNQTEVTYPYGLIEDISDDRHHYKNGQVLTGALWELRNRLQTQFGTETGSKLADYLVFKLSRNAASLFTGEASTVTSGADSTVVLFSKVRDELVNILSTLQAEPNNQSYKDNFDQVHKYTIIEAFNAKGISRFPADKLFDTQTALHNRGGNDTTKLYHSIYDSYGTHTGQYYSTTYDIDVDAPEAWAIQTGDPDVVISVVDLSVVAYSHPEFGNDWRIVNTDLLCPTFLCKSFGNIWTNSLEITGIPNFDDDIEPNLQNQTDDFFGWNHFHSTNDPKFGPSSINFHGTSVAGIIASKASEINATNGIAGMCWDCRIMTMGPGANLSGQNLDALVGNIQYSVDHGANIINLSWGYKDPATNKFPDTEVIPLFNVLKKAEDNDSLVVTAAGNTETLLFDNTDIRPIFPQTSPLKNIINVTAIDLNNNFPQYPINNTLKEYSFGKYTVDLAAPISEFSTNFDDYGTGTAGLYTTAFGKTSSAAPLTSGAISLLLSEQKERIEKALPAQYRKMTLGEIRYLLLTSVDPVPDLKNRTVSGGRLNAYKLLLAYKDSDMDGYTDKIEALFNTDINEPNSFPNLALDHDGDGLSSKDELGYGTIPIAINTTENLTGKIYPIYLDDFGKLLDTNTHGGNPPTPEDTDGDAVSDFEEVSFGSDPANPYSVINNIIINGNIENGYFDLMPQNWIDLNGDTETWAKDVAHSGTRSIKFEKTDNSDFRVYSNTVDINSSGPIQLTIGGWSKADNVVLEEGSQYAIAMIIFYANGTTEMIDNDQLAFQSGSHDWEKAQSSITVEKDIEKIMISMKLTGNSSGTVWFDDLFVHINN